MSEEIKRPLSRLFDRQRIVLWYDRKRELQAEFEDDAFPGVAKITLGNNQFGVKYRILRQEQERKFLLYHADPPLAVLDN